MYYQFSVKVDKEHAGTFLVEDARFIRTVTPKCIHSYRECSTDEWMTTYDIQFWFHPSVKQQINLFGACQSILGVAFRNCPFEYDGELVYIVQGEDCEDYSYCSGLQISRALVQEIYDLLVFEESKPSSGMLKGHRFSDDTLWEEMGVVQYVTPYRCENCGEHFCEGEMLDISKCPVCGLRNCVRRIWSDQSTWFDSAPAAGERQKVQPYSAGIEV